MWKLCDKKTITKLFKIKIKNQDKKRVPYKMCTTCIRELRMVKRKKYSFNLKITVI